MAETYGIYDIEELPLTKVALFSCGLGIDSRVGKKLRGIPYSLQEILQAIQIDELRMFAWSLLSHGGNPPDRISDVMLGTSPKSDVMAFDSAEEFEKAWKGGNE